MKQLVTYLLVLSAISHARSQTEAYFIGNYNLSSGLFRITMDGKDESFGKTYFFSDTVTESAIVKFDWFEPAYIPVPKKKAQSYPKDTVYEALTYRSIPYEVNFVDSILFQGKWVKIVEHKYDGNEIRSLPSTVHKYISVERIGKIYDYDNLFMTRELRMICLSDSTSQKLLVDVYKHLAKGKNNWNNWTVLLELAQKYQFATCVTELSKSWLETKDDIQLVSGKTEYVSDSIQYTVELKNSSETGYCFPKGIKIAPAKRILDIQLRTETWDLLGTDSGYPFQELPEDYYINPGETITISFGFPNETGSAETYEGIQVLTYCTFPYWLLNEPLKRAGRKYSLYPFRSITVL